MPQPPTSSSVYVYSDDTGQQTKGRQFVVAVVALTANRRSIEKELEEIEAESEKRRDDWHGCNPKRLRRYLELVVEVDELRNGVFFRRYEGIEPGQYEACTIDTVLTVAARHQSAERRVFVPEGMPRDARRRLESEARARCRRNKNEVWVGRFEKSALVRLSDALAGLIAQPLINPDSRKNFEDLIADWFIAV